MSQKLIEITAKVGKVVWSEKWIRRREQLAKRSLIRASANVRTRMRRLVRRRKRVAAAGEPPSAHAPGGGGLKAVVFAYDDARQSAVIGPLKFPSEVSPALPGALERGEKVTTRPARGRGPRRRQHFKKHPFASRALNEAIEAGAVLKEFIG